MNDAPMRHLLDDRTIFAAATCDSGRIQNNIRTLGHFLHTRPLFALDVQNNLKMRFTRTH